MTKNSFIFWWCVAWFAWANPVEAQTISNVRIEEMPDAMYIRYDLAGDNGVLYTIYPVVSKRNGIQINPRSMKQSNTGVSVGKNKVLVWYIYDDVLELTGEVSVELRAVRQTTASAPSIASVGGGPENAFLSMLLPGLGDVFVNSPNSSVTVKPVYIMAGYASAVLLAIHAHQMSRESYDAYLLSGSQDEMDSAYQLADEYRTEARFYTTVAGLIWVADVVRVAIKGSMNNQELSRMAQQRTQWSLGRVQNHTTIGLAYRF